MTSKQIGLMHRSDGQLWVGRGWQRKTYREVYRGRRCSPAQAQYDQSGAFSSGDLLGA